MTEQKIKQNVKKCSKFSHKDGKETGGGERFREREQPAQESQVEGPLGAREHRSSSAISIYYS